MNEKQELVIRTLSYLEEHLQETLSLQAVAQLMQYSPYYLHRSFTQLCGMRMHDYVKRRRISEAARCLCETDASVLEIAYPTVMKAHRHFLRPLSSCIR